MVKMRKIFIPFIMLLFLSFFLAFTGDTGMPKGERKKVVIYRPGPKVIFHMKVVKPDPNVDAKILTVKPDPNIDAKILVAEPDYPINGGVSVIDPTRIKPFSRVYVPDK